MEPTPPTLTEFIISKGVDASEAAIQSVILESQGAWYQPSVGWIFKKAGSLGCVSYEQLDPPSNDGKSIGRALGRLSTAELKAFATAKKGIS